MMQCLRAQELVSEALDGVVGDATELATAKEHCRDCQECAAFVRVMLAVKQAGSPEPRNDLTDRVIAHVRAEAAGEGASAPVSAAASPAPTTDFQPDRAPARTWTELAGRALEPRNRRALVGWSLATAALFIAAGIGALAGVRTILVPQRASEMTLAGTATDDALSKSGGASDVAPQSDAAALESEQAGVPASGPSFIVVDGTVYRFTGPASGVEARDLDQVGRTTTALDEGGAASARKVLGSSDPTRVYIEAPDDQLGAFQRVSRTFEGREYALQSGAIERFGEWPTLPAGIRTPSAEDGSPSFAQVGTDASGVAVFASRGSSAGDGIAIAPGAPTADPLGGAPSWSWWTPDR